jgi:hypothetical protein
LFKEKRAFIPNWQDLSSTQSGNFSTFLEDAGLGLLFSRKLFHLNALWEFHGILDGNNRNS